MLELIKMFAHVPGEKMFIGECHPTRASVLVEKDLASWEDGNLLLHILDAHNTILKNNPGAIQGPLDDGYGRDLECRRAWFQSSITKANKGPLPLPDYMSEEGRRRSWFRSFIIKANKLLAKMDRPLPSIAEGRAWAEAEQLKEAACSEASAVAKLGLPLKTVQSVRFKRCGTKFRIYQTPDPDIVFTDAEIEAYFKENIEEVRQILSDSPAYEAEREALRRATEEFLAKQGLPALWESAPNVSQIFGVHSSHTAPSITKEAYDTTYERDRVLLRREYELKDYSESPPTVVAELNQVRCLWAQSELE